MQSPTTCPCKVAAAADAILEQCDAFVAALPPERYAEPAPAMGGGTIGQHARHVLDHFRAALTTPAGDPIDYDHRARGGRVETDPDAARAEIRRLRDLVRAIDEPAMTQEVTARVMLSGAGETADLGSTLGRELFFATHHAIHHHAMMKSIGAGFGVACPNGFGTAPSTLNHQNTAQ